jgi:hypothetical protein
MLNLNVLLEWFGTFLRASPKRMTFAAVKYRARVKLVGCKPLLGSGAGKRRALS